jgi:hypothetical protein
MKRISLVVLCLLSLVFLSIPVHAQTPDGETPANEGVCDKLMGATPGLYGLCVAFCEAQDCPDPDSVSAQCEPSKQKLLEIYNRKKQPGDPEMPCVSQGSCPCFEEYELSDYSPFPTNDFLECIDDTDLGGFITSIRWESSSTVEAIHALALRPDQCYFKYINLEGEIIIRFLQITEEECVACGAIIRGIIDENGCL